MRIQSVSTVVELEAQGDEFLAKCRASVRWC